MQIAWECHAQCANSSVLKMAEALVEAAGATLEQTAVDWQTTKGTVRDRTAFLFNNSLMSDIGFAVKDSAGTQVRVPAHKLVLAISSPVSSLNQEMLASLSKRDTLQINKELELFEAMKRWAQKRCKAEGLEPTGEAMGRALGNVEDLVRWPTISQQDFAFYVEPTDMLTDKESLDIFRYYSGAATARKRKYCEIYRARTISDAALHECCRGLKGISISEGNFEEISEHLDFRAESRNVALKGVHLITETKNRQVQLRSGKILKPVCTADVRLLNQDGDEVAIKIGDYPEKQMDESSAYDPYGIQRLGGKYGIVVEFNNPVLIRKALDYKLEIKFQRADRTALHGIEASSSESVTADGVRFWFGGTSSHIYKLLFYKLNSQ